MDRASVFSGRRIDDLAARVGDSDEVHQLFNGYYYTYVTSASGMKAKKNGKERVINREVLITNFEPPSSKGYGIPIESKQLRFF